ncbi:MAG: hypothetical protein ACYS9X_15555 [Planctomycetota bacterium]|jgi:hypothetical protein
MAAWLWMRYSYCWDVTPAELQPSVAEVHEMFRGRWRTQAYVRVRGRFVRSPLPETETSYVLHSVVDITGVRSIDVRFSPRERRPDNGATSSFVGRVMDMDTHRTPILHTTASRLTGESVAGLIVGAMGIFIFSMYLRRWLRERMR